jgi:hypothetical protein
VPTIAIVAGVRLLIYSNDHPPPHFHATIGDRMAMISIATGEVLKGSLPPSKMNAVRRWLELNRGYVASRWIETRAGE